MSVNPGFGGQRFIPHALEKIREARELRERSHAKFEIEVDGGISLENVRSVAAAGADVVVIGSAIFDTPDCGRTTKQFRELLDGASAT
jgi:ribulose-phosphate 3-epimerase